MTYFVHQRRSGKSKGSRNRNNTSVFPGVRRLQEVVFYYPQLNLKKKQLLRIHFSGKRFYISDSDNSRRLLRTPLQVLLNEKSFQSATTCIQIVTTNRDFHKLLVKVKSCFLCRKLLEKTKRFCYPLPVIDLKEKYATCTTK